MPCAYQPEACGQEGQHGDEQTGEETAHADTSVRSSSGRWKRARTPAVPGGTRPGVASETSTMVRKPSGTDQRAGQASSACQGPAPG